MSHVSRSQSHRSIIHPSVNHGRRPIGKSRRGSVGILDALCLPLSLQAPLSAERGLVGRNLSRHWLYPRLPCSSRCLLWNVSDVGDQTRPPLHPAKGSWSQKLSHPGSIGGPLAGKHRRGRGPRVSFSPGESGEMAGFHWFPRLGLASPGNPGSGMTLGPQFFTSLFAVRRTNHSTGPSLPRGFRSGPLALFTFPKKNGQKGN